MWMANGQYCHTWIRNGAVSGAGRGLEDVDTMGEREHSACPVSAASKLDGAAENPHGMRRAGLQRAYGHLTRALHMSKGVMRVGRRMRRPHQHQLHR